MSPRPVQIVAAFFAHVRSGDVPAAAGLLAADVVWLESGLPPIGGTHVGREAAIRDAVGPFVSQFSEFEIAPERYIESGDEVVVLARYRGVLRGTGRRVEARAMYVFAIKEGVAVRVEQIGDTAQFLAPASPGG